MILKAIALYQIIIYFLACWAIIFGSTTFLQDNSLSNPLISISILIFSGCMILMNLSLIFNFAEKIKFRVLVIQKWVNFLQIFQLSILGVIYNFIAGIYIVAYYYYDDHQLLGMGYDTLKFQWALAYKNGNIIFLGLNVIPIVIFFLLNKIIESVKRKNENRLIDLISHD
jgi:hypothetical protein